MRFTIDPQLLSEIAGSAILLAEITQGGATLFYGLLEDFSDLHGKLFIALPGDPVAGTGRVNTGPE